MKEKIYTQYDNECIFILGIEILKSLFLEGTHLYIDNYYLQVLKIYEDYKKYDNNNISLLDSIHKYIDKKEREILDILRGTYE